jgi:hypothetical protein
LRPPPTIARMLQRKSISTMPMPPLEKSAPASTNAPVSASKIPRVEVVVVCLPTSVERLLERVTVEDLEARVRPAGEAPCAAWRRPQDHKGSPGEHAVSLMNMRPLFLPEKPPAVTRGGARTVVLVEPHEEELVLLLAAQVHERHGSLLGAAAGSRLLPSLPFPGFWLPLPRRLPFFSRLFFSPRSCTEETPRIPRSGQFVPVYTNDTVIYSVVPVKYGVKNQ